MTVVTNVPQPTFGPNGFIAPTESAVMAGVWLDYQAAFFGNLNQQLATPQGQLVSSTTAIIGNANSTFTYFCNQVDPAFAQGRMQDAIARIYFLTRKPALPTSVSCACTGLLNTVIPAGALAEDESGNLYSADTGGTIPAGGTITLSFSNTIPGPTACPANTLNAIYQAIPGWDTINNASDGVLGQSVESRAAFEGRRQQSVAANSRNTIQAIQGKVLEVPLVTDCYAYSNNTASPATVQGVTIEANSIYVSAIGDSDANVAQAIWLKAPPGIPYAIAATNTSVTVSDTNPAYSAPVPTYVVKFNRPTALTVYFDVQITNSALVPANAATLIQNAIVNAFSGSGNIQRAKIGSTIYASSYYAVVALLGPWANIIAINVGSNNATDATFTGTVSGTALTVSSVTGTIKSGGVLSGAGVPEGTLIVSGSGTSWVVSNSFTAGPVAMKSASAVNNSVSVNANQAPVTAAADIQVVLV